ncbi:SDR family oxidoreductase [Maritimibacter sp. DP1N21-5]|uniref:SDR family oxidoreductase n=1 Tax=Maritimibacter sp. DP1N21-5 TaxID=2836867 RepID=UPI001C44E840|nr:SDR family oxidoreductase [Maritimibacter sp. DP1N21-5]MBV7410220.1 SDR family oxidoreductase [Maritimibacter sp. DP1N21-5]
MSKHLVTGASGQLGAHVLAALEGTLPRSETAVLVRKEDDRARLAAEGYDVRVADYTDVAALTEAFAGIERLLLISSSEVGQRLPQHQNVIDAAKAAGVGFIAYTSILAADRSPLALAEEHRATEEALAASGIAHTLLRNGWYSENITMTAGQDIELGQHFGAAGDGRFATAARADYAAAAAKVLTGSGHEGRTYELGGDNAYSLADYAGALSDVAGKPVTYTDLPRAAFEEALTGAGLPAPLAGVLADSDDHAKAGWLDTTSRDLSELIGRPTTPIAETIRASL